MARPQGQRRARTGTAADGGVSGAGGSKADGDVATMIAVTSVASVCAELEGIF